MSKLILVIDDEREIGILLEEVVQSDHVTVEQVYNGTDALMYLELHSPDLVLLDLQLPEINGLEILHYINTKEIPSRVVIITAFGSVETAVDALKNGASDYLCKPFSLQDLEQIIHQHLTHEGMGENQVISLEDVERKHIALVLRKNNGNRRKTAHDLGISLRTLYYKIKQYDLA